MKTCAAITLLSLLLVVGCPNNGTTDDSAVTAAVAASSTQGAAPLTITFSAASSASTNGGTLTYAWDFDDGTTSNLVALAHTFTNPGRYIVKLRVTDELGETDITSVEIRAAGAGATAVIVTNVTSGTAPLVVQFDGTTSVVPDDTILDYYWDFADGTTSREAQPRHTFYNQGNYGVALRIVTAGGVEATTSVAITVGKPEASLQFDGTAFATLPLGSAYALTAFTLEAWVKPDNDGGIIASVGSGSLTIEIQPSANRIRLQIGGTPTDAAATNLAGAWRHIAVVYDGVTASSCSVYLDGAPLANTPVAGALTFSQLTLGVGLRGKLGEVRLWSTAREAAAILTTLNERLDGTETNLLAYWPIFEGSGQILRNHVTGGTDGVLGSTTASESSDPAWSTDGPPL